MGEGNLIYKDECYALVGAFINVYKEVGAGLAEPIYQDCLEIELGLLHIPFVAQEHLPVFYKGIKLKRTYVPDFLCYDKIIVEIKAVSKLTDEHRAQLLNYLRITGIRLGLLVNFAHHPLIEWQRIAN